MTEVQRLAQGIGEDGQVEFGQDESHLFFQFGGRLLTSRKLTGQFPNYEAVLPRDANKTLVLEKEELQSALRRVAQLADQRTHAVKFMLSNEGMELSSSSPDYGEAKEVIGKEYKGETIAIGFNAQYLSGFSSCFVRRPDQLRAERRTICRTASACRQRRLRLFSLSLRRDADAHLTTHLAQPVLLAAGSGRSTHRATAASACCGRARTMKSSVRFTQRTFPVGSIKNSAGLAISAPSSLPCG